jgi:hypothetical protein
MNFNNNSRFFKSAFNNFNKSSGKKFFTGSTFKTFFTYNMQRQMSFLNSIYRSQKNGVMLLNNVSKMNFITVTTCANIKKTVIFLSNNCTSNGGLAAVGQQMNSDFLTLIEEMLKCDETLLENGR